MRIGILGMGGIGSFVGAKLAQNYRPDEQIKTIFICRGKTKENILSRGLLLTSENGTIHVKPDLVSNDPDEIELLDILIVATKSFSLIHGITQFQKCLKKETIIIPLLNGVNAKTEIIQHIEHESSKILEGCIYVASNVEEPGKVKHVGGPGKIYFGNTEGADQEWVEEILRKGGLEASYTKEIKRLLWQKYLFVSPLAAMTTALGITFGELAENPQYRKDLEKMMKELQAVANKFHVVLTDQDVRDSLAMLSSFPHEAKSSLQLDFESGNLQTEKRDLVDFIVENGTKLKVKVETYKEMEEKISTYHLA